MRILRPGNRILTIGNPGLSVISPRGGAAIPWYLSGGVDAANCVAAYQPIGAADYAASKVNLANSGTYDAAAGNDPDWDDTNGWKFNGIDNYLDCTYLYSAVSGACVIVRFTDAGYVGIQTGTIIGAVNGADLFVGANTQYGVRACFFGSYVNILPSMTSGVIALTDGKFYRDGSYSHDVAAGGTLSSSRSLKIGAGWFSFGWHYTPVYVQAAAAYDSNLTADQVAAITTAMAAL